MVTGFMKICQLPENYYKKYLFKFHCPQFSTNIDVILALTPNVFDNMTLIIRLYLWVFLISKIFRFTSFTLLQSVYVNIESRCLTDDIDGLPIT